MTRNYFWLALCSCTWGIPAPVWGLEFADIAGRLPAASELVVSTDDWAETCARFGETELGRLVTGSLVAPLRAELAAANVATLLYPRPACGLDWSDLSGIDDPGALAVLPHPDGSAGWILLIFPAQPSSQMPPVLKQVVDFHHANGWESSEDQTGEVFVRRLRTRRGNRQQPEGNTTRDRAVFWGPACYGVVSDASRISSLLTLSENESLAATDRFRSLHTNIRAADPDAIRSGDLRFYVRPFSLARTLAGSRASAAQDEDLLDPLARAERLGLARIEALAGTLRLAPEGSAEVEMAVRTAVLEPLTGLLQWADFRTGMSSAWPEWLEASVQGVQRWHGNVPSAMRGWGALFDELIEPGPYGVGLFDDLLAGLRDDPAGPRVDLAEDLFPALGPSLLIVEVEGRSGDGPFPAGAGWLFVVECRETERVRGLLRRFYESDRQVTRERRGNYDVWTVPAGGSLFVAGETEDFATLRALAVGQGELLMGTEPEQVWAAMAGKKARTPLSESPAWETLRAWLDSRRGDGTVWRGMGRDNQDWETSYETARTTEGRTDVGWEVALWDWMLYGRATAPQRQALRSAPPYSSWKHAISGQAAQLDLGGNEWKLDAAWFSE